VEPVHATPQKCVSAAATPQKGVSAAATPTSRTKMPRVKSQLQLARAMAMAIASSFCDDTAATSGISSSSVVTVRQRINSCEPSAVKDLFSVGAQLVIVVGGTATERHAFCIELANLLGGQALPMRALEAKAISEQTEHGVLVSDAIMQAKMVQSSTRLQILLEAMRAGGAPFVLCDFLHLAELEQVTGPAACVLQLPGAAPSARVPKGRAICSLASPTPSAALSAVRSAGIEIPTVGEPSIGTRRVSAAGLARLGAPGAPTGAAAAEAGAGLGRQCVLVLGGATAARGAFCGELAASLGGRHLELRALQTAEMAAATKLGRALSDAFSQAQLITSAMRLELLMGAMSGGGGPFVLSLECVPSSLLPPPHPPSPPTPHPYTTTTTPRAHPTLLPSPWPGTLLSSTTSRRPRDPSPHSSSCPATRTASQPPSRNASPRTGGR
jgi:hypothetical protein